MKHKSYSPEYKAKIVLEMLKEDEHTSEIAFGGHFDFNSSEFDSSILSAKTDPSIDNGNCWDNAVAESFFHTLKEQYVRGQVFTSIEQARLILFEYIEIYYNHRRLHSASSWESPQNYENKNYYQYVA